MTDPTIHLEGPGGLFASTALCGATHDAETVLRMTDAPEWVDCPVCLDLIFPTEETTA